MLRTPLQRLYERLGPRYPRVVLAFAFLLAYFVVGGGVLLLNLYVDISLDTFWRIVARLGGPRRRSRSAPPCGWATGWCARPTAGCAASARPTPRWPPGRRSPGCPSTSCASGAACRSRSTRSRSRSSSRSSSTAPSWASWPSRRARSVVLALRRLRCASSSPSSPCARCSADVSLRPARRRRPRRALGAAARQAARRAAGRSTSSRASSSPAWPPGTRACGRSALGVLVALVVAFTISLRAVAAARALGGRADRGPARGHRARDARGDLGVARARARHRRDRPPGGVVQPDGRRPGGARAPARGVRRLRRPAARRARARGGHGARGRGGRGDRPLRRHPRVHGLRRARQRERGRRPSSTRFYELVVPVLVAPRRPRQQVHRRRAARRLRRARAPRRPRRPRRGGGARDRRGRARAPTAGGCASASASTPARWWPAPSAAAAASSSRSSATRSTPRRAWRGSRARPATPCSSPTRRCALLRDEHGGFAERGTVTLRGRSEPVTLHVAMAAADEPVAPPALRLGGLDRVAHAHGARARRRRTTRRRRRRACRAGPRGRAGSAGRHGRRRGRASSPRSARWGRRRAGWPCRWRPRGPPSRPPPTPGRPRPRSSCGSGAGRRPRRRGPAETAASEPSDMSVTGWSSPPTTPSSLTTSCTARPRCSDSAAAKGPSTMRPGTGRPS